MYPMIDTEQIGAEITAGNKNYDFLSTPDEFRKRIESSGYKLSLADLLEARKSSSKREILMQMVRHETELANQALRKDMNLFIGSSVPYSIVDDFVCKCHKCGKYKK